MIERDFDIPFIADLALDEVGKLVEVYPAFILDSGS
jgi:hypothetical protein